MDYQKILFFLRNISLYAVLVSFIILNFLDFFNLFSLILKYTGDVDFLKKLISWSLIYYLFASLSITKIITGFRNKFYDGYLLLGYGLITLPSILLFYVRNSDPSHFYLFSFLFDFIQNLLQFNILLLVAGLGIIFIISTLIFINLSIHRESFVGSFNLDMEKYFSQVYKLILIIGFNIFFAFTFFKFFMEWFALAIDAALLVFGFGYYLYYYFILKKEKTSVKHLLKDIVNTGSSFFKQLVLYLQDRKTFFIGISLLLTIHLLVDLGVYLIPFATGIDNGLYNVLGDDSDTIRSLFGVEDSWLHFQFYQLSQNLNFGSFTLLFQVLIIAIESIFYIENLLLYLILLAMPFIVFISTLQNKIYIPSKKVIIFTLMMILVQLSLFLPEDNLNNAIEFSFSNSSDEELGIVFVAKPLFENLESISIITLILEIAFIIILHLVILFFLFVKYEKFRSFWISTFYVSILVFFLFYSTVFAQNYIGVLYNENFNSEFLIEDLNMEANSIYYLTEVQKIQTLNLESKTLTSFKANVGYSVKSDWYSVIDYSNFSNSYNLVGLEIDFDKDISKYHSFNYDNALNGVSIYFFNYSSILDSSSEQNKIFVLLKFSDEHINDVLNLEKKILTTQSLHFIESKPNKTMLSLFVSLFSLAIVSLFYVGGLIAYAIFYRNALEELKRKLF